MLDGISDVQSLRDNLRIRCEYYIKGIPQGSTKTLCSMYSGTLCLYERIRRNQHCKDLYVDSVKSIFNIDEIGLERCEELLQSIQLMEQDLARIHPCAAALSWISPDLNLNSLFDDPFIPTDLSYGLLLKSFRPVLRVCNYLTATGSYTKDINKFRSKWNAEEYCNELIERTGKWVNLPAKEVRELVKEIMYV